MHGTASALTVLRTAKGCGNRAHVHHPLESSDIVSLHHHADDSLVGTGRQLQSQTPMGCGQLRRYPAAAPSTQLPAAALALTTSMAALQPYEWVQWAGTRTGCLKLEKAAALVGN
jgi:hypothetical protein